MNKRSWFLYGDNGKQYRIGMLHGPKSGHLLVYYNNRILIIDFKILDSKTYSFVIDDELVELSISRQPKRFEYAFKINEDVETPKNIQRRLRKKKNKIGAIIFGVFGIGGIIGLILFCCNLQSAKIA